MGVARNCLIGIFMFFVLKNLDKNFKKKFPKKEEFIQNNFDFFFG